MHNSLGNPFVIEMGDLLPGMKVLEKCWPAGARRKGVIGAIDANTLLRGEISGATSHASRIQLFLFRIRCAVHCRLLCGVKDAAAGYPAAA
ncbi:hypothetical protein BKG84_28370 [Mycobacteroides chelonae]|uniref:Uncharacterized protein n=1 Tax=Mycobacteroides chelonae TaxID=1774 RepID=A0A1S1LZB0_MYCCH|nr:hypothetical protein BKG84_28370 [Mycobacteroides chelonae]